LKSAGLEGKVELRPTGCHGFCERGPLVLLFPSEILYQKVKPVDVKEIVRETLVNGKILDRMLVTDAKSGSKFQKESEIPFYKNQKRFILKNNGMINPCEINDYIATGGYSALCKSMKIGADTVLAEVVKADLRGRGGAGFPAGKKWEACRKQVSNIKYVICNADEGDPGAFMDRSIIEGNPHLVLEGMIIGAFAIGSSEGFIYIRQEYPLAVKRMEKAISQAMECGLLGKNILGSGFSFDVKIKRGGGAFVCGEASALVASIEGRRGVPRRRYPHLSESGLWGKPTNLNNVETWANVPLIINNGSDWFRSIGTGGSKGTKIFSLVGKVNNTGLVEVPMGMTLRQVIFDIGGGIPGGKRFKAVQTGGPSGGCLPESRLDLPIDFDTLTSEGSLMGSGGMIVMDEGTCMVDVARYFTGFLRSESCGNCTSCRDGLKELHRMLTLISEGKGTDETIAMIEELSETIKTTSLCTLGTTSVNPVHSTLKHFRNEYLAHIHDKKCPAGVCKALITYSINDKCNGCHVCWRQCPRKCISGEMKKPHVIDQSSCIKCGICRDVCRFDAVDLD